MVQSIDATAGGEFAVGDGTLALKGAHLAAGAGAVATAVVRETDGSGRILYKLAAAAGETSQVLMPVAYQVKVHVTVTGAGAQLNIFV